MRGARAADLADLQKVRGDKGVALQTTSLADIEKDPALLAFAQAQGRAAFANNCAPCHGVGAAGTKGYPNLNDDDWLWGATVTEIQRVIAYGVRSGHSEAHESTMPAFGKNGILKPDDILSVANYMRSLSGLPTRPGVDLAKGKTGFRRHLLELPW
jgi:cytochrome c oxidase cbb3-type subunit 3